MRSKKREMNLAGTGRGEGGRVLHISSFCGKVNEFLLESPLWIDIWYEKLLQNWVQMKVR